MPNKTLEDKIKEGRQYRSMKLEVRASEEGEDKPSYIVEGYATTFDDPYLMWRDGDVEWYEQVAREAFKNADMSDVILQYDHEGHVYARLSNNTLSLMCDDHGLFVRADLGGTEDGRKLYEEIKGGYTDKMSFCFTVADDELLREEKDGKIKYTRNITAIDKLYDVSAVSIPANDGTAISARNYCNGVIAKEEAERLLKAEEEKKLQEERASRERELALLELEQYRTI